LRELETWCEDNFLKLDVKKSVVMIFGPLPNPIPAIAIYGTCLQVKDIWPYVGVWLQSTSRDIFAAHYHKKLELAISSSRSLFGCERLVGRARLPPHIARILYLALVDCHLIHGCDVAVDVDPSSFQPLYKLQLRLLRRILGLPHNSPITPLFTELDLIPLRTRRLELCLNYLTYAVSLPDSDLVSLALQASSNLRSRGCSCWLMDIDWAISNLPGSQDHLPALAHLTPSSMKFIFTYVRELTFHRLNSDLDCLHRLRFLKARLEPQENGPSVAVSIHLRHYLRLVTNFRHRHALTRLLCGSLAPGMFRATPGKCTLRNGQVNSDYTCRRCGAPFETPEHVLLQCSGIPELLPIRTQFRASLMSSIPDLNPQLQLSDGDALRLLKRAIFSWTEVRTTAKFVHNAIQLWSLSTTNTRIIYGSEDEEDEM
jgi:hypothetical protein